MNTEFFAQNFCPVPVLVNVIRCFKLPCIKIRADQTLVRLCVPCAAVVVGVFQLLRQRGHHARVLYEYSVPRSVRAAVRDTYEWRIGAWQACSASCGTGALSAGRENGP